MGTDSKIEWTHHTFNVWEGCEKVSPGCKHCYACDRDKRWHDGEHWGPGSTRKPMSESYWNKPRRWHGPSLAGAPGRAGRRGPGAVPDPPSAAGAVRQLMASRYIYLGDKFTRDDLVGASCDPVRRADGKCIVGRNAVQLVRFETGEEHVVLRRRLRLRSKL